jgi:hypothetical protein
MPAAKKSVEKAEKKHLDEVEAVHEKREAFDNPPADPPVPVAGAVKETLGVDEKDPALIFAIEGGCLRVTLGKESTLLDPEGVRSAFWHFSKASASL